MRRAVADGGKTLLEGLAILQLRQGREEVQLASAEFSRVMRPPFGHAVRTLINGSPALLVHRNGIAELMLTISVNNERITAIYAVRNPEKLARLGP